MTVGAFPESSDDLPPSVSAEDGISSKPHTPIGDEGGNNASGKPTDGSKLRTLLGILKNFIGVTDLAAVRFSLPPQLLEPRPNLEYWNYIDVPNAFVAIGSSDQPIDRMLEVVRFWLTKDLKYAKERPCKPYNSCIGEFFRCNWETENNAPLINTKALSSRSSSSSNVSAVLGSSHDESVVSLSVPPVSSTQQSINADASSSKIVKVSYLTEQTSHHPPVSAFYVSCPDRGLTARGFDQITAKFTGTSIKVLPGEHNLGIFVTLDRHGGETYQLTHPAAYLGGLLRGSLSVSVGEMAYITCPQTRIKVILHYVEQGWLGRTTNQIDGVIFRYDPDSDDKHRVRDVPDEDVIARLSGPWREKVVFTMGPKPVIAHPPESRYTIIDIRPLNVAPKLLPPAEMQLPNESLTTWHGVTEAILARQFSRATALKHEIEENQRELARERERTSQPFHPVFFNEMNGNPGRPELTACGVEVLRRLQESNWSMKDLPS